MKRLSSILYLLCLSVTIVHAQRYWPVSCSESGLKGKVHEVVTMTHFPADSTGLGLKMVVETRLFSPEGLLTNIFESNPGNDYSTEFVYNGELLTDAYFYSDAKYHYQYYYSSDGKPSLIVVSAIQGETNWPNDTISVSYENGKLVFNGVETPSNDTFTQSIILTDNELESEYDEFGNWIYCKRSKYVQTRHIVYW